MNEPMLTRYIQSNILITQDGQACLGDFGITGVFLSSVSWYKLESLQYMAPERFSSWDRINSSSKESDVYSLAVTSFKVCFSAVDCPIIWSDHPIMIRFSQGYHHMVTVINARWLLILDAANDHLVQHTQIRTNGCRTMFGIQL
jgi:serine/threonine protein kinase